eukprot:GGOE01043026.1.p6 GENE.GGOE01043026.1~~GGOE01043026.1.p6  ORF type:complete len:145 (+),score=9.92 GGOE01043026.1:1083-1517(+)
MDAGREWEGGGRSENVPLRLRARPALACQLGGKVSSPRDTVEGAEDSSTGQGAAPSASASASGKRLGAAGGGAVCIICAKRAAALVPTAVFGCPSAVANTSTASCAASTFLGNTETCPRSSVLCMSASQHRSQLHDHLWPGTRG